MAKAPGQSHRKGMTFVQTVEMFDDEETSRKWFEEQHWPDGPFCPHCGSFNVQSGIKHHSMTHRCRDCFDKRKFSVRVGTILENSRLPYRTWAIGIYLFTTNLKGISSMKLHRELGITQKTAWFMLHRLRAAMEANNPLFQGPVETDETFVGGKEGNKHARKKLKAGRGTVGKTAVAGVKDRPTRQVVARVVENTDKTTLQGFVNDHAAEGATLYTRLCTKITQVRAQKIPLAATSSRACSRRKMIPRKSPIPCHRFRWNLDHPQTRHTKINNIQLFNYPIYLPNSAGPKIRATVQPHFLNSTLCIE